MLVFSYKHLPVRRRHQRSVVAQERLEDGEEQQPRSDAKEGVVRLFVVSQEISDKGAAEATVAARMAEITGDLKWEEGAEAIKTLARWST